MSGATITYVDWLKNLPGTDAEYAACSCAVCGSTGLEYQYFGFKGSDYGWKLVWCNSCNSGLRVSRTKVPEDAQVLIEESDQKAFMENHRGLKLIS